MLNLVGEDHGVGLLLEGLMFDIISFVGPHRRAMLRTSTLLLAFVVQGFTQVKACAEWNPGFGSASSQRALNVVVFGGILVLSHGCSYIGMTSHHRFGELVRDAGPERGRQEVDIQSTVHVRGHARHRLGSRDLPLLGLKPGRITGPGLRGAASATHVSQNRPNCWRLAQLGVTHCTWHMVI
ncbi:hypothetical protein ANO11243_008840 [Dothideomycetidae sp. 11243]|nr:hypothetical protein ANO11243_008840 [fungal sp. No.11243]